MPNTQGSIRTGGGGTQTFAYQKWPDKIFPIVNFVVSYDGPVGLGEGGGPKGLPPLLRWRTAILMLPCQYGRPICRVVGKVIVRPPGGL